MTAQPVASSAPVVLLVDDDPGVRTFLGRVLDAEGYTVLTAADGAAAMRLVEHLHQPLQLLITDLRMPVVGGEELAEWLRRRRPETPVLFITGFSSRYDPPSLSTPLLHKPFTPEKLCADVRQILDQTALSRYPAH